MADVVSPLKRSQMMSGISAKNTRPEILVRSILHRAGFRFRVHSPNLPGKPDIVLRKYRAVIQVNGCFWHSHNCHLFKVPASNRGFWEKKLAGTRARDAENRRKLKESGWRVCVVWECAIKGKKKYSEQELAEKLSIWIVGGSTRIEEIAFAATVPTAKNLLNM